MLCRITLKLNFPYYHFNTKLVTVEGKPTSVPAYNY